MADETGAEQIVADGSMFSMLDVFVISSAVGFCVYWFFIRTKKKPEFTEIKRLAPM